MSDGKTSHDVWYDYLVCFSVTTNGLLIFLFNMHVKSLDIILHSSLFSI